MATIAAEFDLGRTLPMGAGGPVPTSIMRDQGVIDERTIPGERFVCGRAGDEVGA